MIANIGRRTFGAVNHILNLSAFAFRICRFALHLPIEGRALLRRVILEQIYFTGFQALPVLIPVGLLIGSMLIVIFAQVSAQYDLGKTTVLLVVREIGPLVTALVLILRSATSVTIQISYMKVFHEIEAIEMGGMDPIRVICLPRLIGIIISLLCLFVVFDLVSIIGGYAVVWGVTYIPMGNFLEQIGKALTGTDIIVGFLKAVCFGSIVTVTSLYHGFRDKKSIADLPEAASRAAIEGFSYCLAVNVVISAGFYV